MRKSRSDAWGIQNHLGGIWTPQAFGSEEEAYSYLHEQQRSMRGLKDHKVVRIRLTIISPKDGAKPRKVL